MNASAPPRGDPRFEQVEAVMKRHQYRQDALIEVLHAAQNAFGCLEPGLLHFVAHHLKLPLSRVYGVATFYHFFTLQPGAEHTCVVCMGTACYVQGAGALLAAAREAGDGPDARWSLRTARCIGACCSLAPTVILDGTVQGHQTPEGLLRQVKGWSRGTGRPA